MAFERLLRLTKKCPGYVVSGLRNAKRWYSNCHSRVVRKLILHHPGSFYLPVSFCDDSSTSLVCVCVCVCVWGGSSLCVCMCECVWGERERILQQVWS